MSSYLPRIGPAASTVRVLPSDDSAQPKQIYAESKISRRSSVFDTMMPVMPVMPMLRAFIVQPEVLTFRDVDCNNTFVLTLTVQNASANVRRFMVPRARSKVKSLG